MNKHPRESNDKTKRPAVIQDTKFSIPWTPSAMPVTVSLTKSPTMSTSPCTKTVDSFAHRLQFPFKKHPVWELFDWHVFSPRFGGVFWRFALALNFAKEGQIYSAFRRHSNTPSLLRRYMYLFFQKWYNLNPQTPSFGPLKIRFLVLKPFKTVVFHAFSLVLVLLEIIVLAMTHWAPVA